MGRVETVTSLPNWPPGSAAYVSLYTYYLLHECLCGGTGDAIAAA